MVAYESDGSTELFDFDKTAGYRVRAVTPVGRVFRERTVSFDDVPGETVVSSVAGAANLVLIVDCYSSRDPGGAAALAYAVVTALCAADLREWVLKVTYDDGRVEAWDVLRQADVAAYDDLTPSTVTAGLVKLQITCRVAPTPTITPAV